MKKLLIALMAMFTVCNAAFADATGLKVVMKEGGDDAIQILFTDSPVLTHNEDGTEIIIKYAGAESPAVFKTADVAMMAFAEITETSGIQQLFRPENDAVMGIYSLGGQKITNAAEMQKGKVYIINGHKVLVK